MPFPESNLVLSFARGRARRVARALLDLEFQRDRDGLRAHRALWFGRARRRSLEQKIDACVRQLVTLEGELDQDDPIRRAIDRVRTCHAVRGFRFGRRDAENAELAWGQALHELERSLSTRSMDVGKRSGRPLASKSGLGIKGG